MEKQKIRGSHRIHFETEIKAITVILANRIAVDESLAMNYYEKTGKHESWSWWGYSLSRYIPDVDLLIAYFARLKNILGISNSDGIESLILMLRKSHNILRFNQPNSSIQVTVGIVMIKHVLEKIRDMIPSAGVPPPIMDEYKILPMTWDECVCYDIEHGN